MMKLIAAIALSFSSLGSSTGPGTPLKLTPFGISTIAASGKPSWKPAIVKDHKITVTTRGGSSTLTLPGDDSDLLATASDALLNLFATISTLHSVALAFAPSIGRKLLSIDEEEADDTTAYVQESIGVFMMEFALTACLAASGKVSIEKAVGYGTVPDILFLSKNLLNGQFGEFGVRNGMIGVTLVTTSFTAAILADKLHFGPIMEALTVAGGIQGAVKYVNPVLAGKMFVGEDLDEKPLVKALFRTAGQLKLVSSLFRSCLILGVKPLRALSYATFFNAALEVDSIVRKTTKGIGERAWYHQVGALALTLTMGGVWYLNSAD